MVELIVEKMKRETEMAMTSKSKLMMTMFILELKYTLLFLSLL